MEELDTDEYIRRIKALNAIKDQYEFTTSIQVISVTRVADLFPIIIMSEITISILTPLNQGTDQSRPAPLELSQRRRVFQGGRYFYKVGYQTHIDKLINTNTESQMKTLTHGRK